MGFFMSFVLLLVALAAFDVRAEQANQQALSVHFEDIANRAANAVLGAVDVGAHRAASEATAPSDELVYYEKLRIPTEIRGQRFSVELDATQVTVTDGLVTETAPLFNLQVPAVCDDDEAVCSLSGTSDSNQGFILLKYEYKRGANPLVDPPITNQITIG